MKNLGYGIPGALFALTLLVAAAASAQSGMAAPSFDMSGYLPEVVEKVGELPMVKAGSSLTVFDAVRMTAERNTTLEVMRAEVEKSRWQTATAWAMIMPMVELGATYAHADHETSVVFDMSEFYKALGITPPESSGEPTVIQRQDTFNGSATVSISLINVAAWYTIAMAQSGDRLMKLSYEQVKEQLESGVVQAFLAAIMTESVIRLQESQVQVAAHHLDFSMKKFKAGSGLKIDVIRAEADLVKAKQELLNAHLAYESARDALGILTGVSGLPVPVGDPVIDASPSVTADFTDNDDALIQALDIRNDIKVQQAGLDLAKKTFTASWGGYLPTVVGGWQGTYQFTEPASFGSDDRSRWNLFLNISIPIFEWGKIGDIKQKKLAVDIAELKVDDARTNASKEIREAGRQYRTAVANLEISSKQVELAREAFQLVDSAFVAGAGSSLEVTDAMRNRLAAEVGALTSELRVKIALVNLNVAMGKKVADIVR